MKNFVFISPNFPVNYWHFCHELKNNGLNVLGIGDQPYDELDPNLKNSLNEYYKVSSLENYDEVYRAVAFFISKYGRIDWLESNNEYWLEKDAMLRTDFNIATGFKNEDMPPIKYKSKMKENYIKAGIPVARFHLADDLEGCRKFVAEVGYPVIAKPDNGVGAAGTYKMSNDEELVAFINEYPKHVSYIMEEFIHAMVTSYDAIVDSKGEPIFEASNVTPSNLLEVVRDLDDSLFYIQKEVPEDVRKAGRAALKSFGVTSRFVHFEFFRLLSDHEGLGREGDVVALEVNMRPSGGATPDMINFAHSTDVYKIWADMIAFDGTDKGCDNHQYCAFIGRRDSHDYVYDNEALVAKYAANLKLHAPVPDALSGAMGNYQILCTFDTKEELDQFYDDGVKVK